jgi:hypothetical protein
MPTPADRTILSLLTRLKLMREVSLRNKYRFHDAGDIAGTEYYRGEAEGLRLALNVLNDLIRYYEEK